MAYGNVSLPRPTVWNVLVPSASLFEVSFSSWPFNLRAVKLSISNRSRHLGFTHHIEGHTGVRCASLEAGEHKTGHIATGPNEGILFFDRK